jgi:hypothetical protein
VESLNDLKRRKTAEELLDDEGLKRRQELERQRDAFRASLKDPGTATQQPAQKRATRLTSVYLHGEGNVWVVRVSQEELAAITPLGSQFHLISADDLTSITLQVIPAAKTGKRKKQWRLEVKRSPVMNEADTLPMFYAEKRIDCEEADRRKRDAALAA